MPKTKVRRDLERGHGSRAARWAAKKRQSGPYQKLVKEYEGEEKNGRWHQETEFEMADPNTRYLVGGKNGKVVLGSEFPEGVLPANVVESPPQVTKEKMTG